MQQERKGTYCFIGNDDTPMVHHPQFILDQRILPKGAAYWARDRRACSRPPTERRARWPESNDQDSRRST
jgi:hypothetical protein